jgi:hypothetical protein
MIKIAMAGISALFFVAMMSKSQHQAVADTGKGQITASAQHLCAGTLSRSQLFYAEK